MCSPDLHLFLGLDLGQRQDPSALAILHRFHESLNQRDPITYQPQTRLRLLLTHVERVPLGTPYLSLIEKVRILIRSLAPSTITLSVDASGVGAPIVELLRHAKLGCRLLPVTITSTGLAHRHPVYGDYIPRRELLTRLRVAFESGTLQIARNIHDRGNLIQELLTLSDRPTAKHDDLALAVALALSNAIPAHKLAGAHR